MSNPRRRLNYATSPRPAGILNEFRRERSGNCGASRNVASLEFTARIIAVVRRAGRF